jgi:hypothetical protein
MDELPLASRVVLTVERMAVMWRALASKAASSALTSSRNATFLRTDTVLVSDAR